MKNPIKDPILKVKEAIVLEYSVAKKQKNATAHDADANTDTDAILEKHLSRKN